MKLEEYEELLALYSESLRGTSAPKRKSIQCLKHGCRDMKICFN